MLTFTFSNIQTTNKDVRSIKDVIFIGKQRQILWLGSFGNKNVKLKSFSFFPLTLSKWSLKALFLPFYLLFQSTCTKFFFIFSHLLFLWFMVFQCLITLFLFYFLYINTFFFFCLSTSIVNGPSRLHSFVSFLFILF